MEKESAVIRGCIEGLMSYAVECQAGFERHQPDGMPSGAELRVQRIRALIAGMAELYQLSGDIQADFLTPFEERLSAARSCLAVELTPLKRQRDTVKGLQQYAGALCDQAGDPRRTLLKIRDQLNDIVVSLSWDVRRIDLYSVRDWLDGLLPRLTALQPIRFTRILLGPEIGPAESDFVSGAVTEAAAVKDTRLYDEMCRQYPEVREWPAICVVYQGGRDALRLRDANELDLAIMREAGDRFLDLRGVSWIGGPYELEIADGPMLSM